MSRLKTTNAEDGRILILSLGVALLAMTLIVVTLVSSIFYLEHKRLRFLADQVASFAATRPRPAHYFAGQEKPAIEETQVYMRAHKALDSAQEEELRGLRDIQLKDLRVDGPQGQVYVVLQAVADIPLVPEVLQQWAGGIDIEVSAVSHGYGRSGRS
ncbi:MAG: hypothetical protein Q4G30_02105 [Actinomycetaceae bacterium]|nr:hypothetical protein [Actinomycetaceae bacterium]